MQRQCAAQKEADRAFSAAAAMEPRPPHTVESKPWSQQQQQQQQCLARVMRPDQKKAHTQQQQQQQQQGQQGRGHLQTYAPTNLVPLGAACMPTRAPTPAPPSVGAVATFRASASVPALVAELRASEEAFLAKRASAESERAGGTNGGAYSTASLDWGESTYWPAARAEAAAWLDEASRWITDFGAQAAFAMGMGYLQRRCEWVRDATWHASQLLERYVAAEVQQSSRLEASLADRHRTRSLLSASTSRPLVVAAVACLTLSLKALDQKYDPKQERQLYGEIFLTSVLWPVEASGASAPGGAEAGSAARVSTRKELAAMEWRVLAAVGWKVESLAPTPFMFVDALRQDLGLRSMLLALAVKASPEVSAQWSLYGMDESHQDQIFGTADDLILGAMSFDNARLVAPRICAAAALTCIVHVLSEDAGAPRGPLVSTAEERVRRLLDLSVDDQRAVRALRRAMCVMHSGWIEESNQAAAEARTRQQQLQAEQRQREQQARAGGQAGWLPSDLAAADQKQQLTSPGLSVGESETMSIVDDPSGATQQQQQLQRRPGMRAQHFSPITPDDGCRSHGGAAAAPIVSAPMDVDRDDVSIDCAHPTPALAGLASPTPSSRWRLQRVGSNESEFGHAGPSAKAPSVLVCHEELTTH